MLTRLLTITALSICTAAAKPVIGVASNMQPMIESVQASVSTPFDIASSNSNQLVTHTNRGAPYDAIIVASRASADAIKASADKYLLGNGVLALTCQNNEQLTDISQQSIAIANPKLAPFGRAAQQWLGTRQPKRLIYARSASQAFQYMNGGHTDCAITSLSWVDQTKPFKALNLDSADLEQWLLVINTQLDASIVNAITSADVTAFGYQGAQ